MNSTEIYWINDIMHHPDLKQELKFAEAFDEILEEQKRENGSEEDDKS